MAWNDLSMQERAAAILVAVKNGIYDRLLIIDTYNKFDEGGPTLNKEDLEDGRIRNLLLNDTMDQSGSYELTRDKARKYHFYKNESAKANFDRLLDYISAYRLPELEVTAPRLHSYGGNLFDKGGPKYVYKRPYSDVRDLVNGITTSNGVYYDNEVPKNSYVYVDNEGKPILNRDFEEYSKGAEYRGEWGKSFIPLQYVDDKPYTDVNPIISENLRILDKTGIPPLSSVIENQAFLDANTRAHLGMSTDLDLKNRIDVALDMNNSLIGAWLDAEEEAKKYNYYDPDELEYYRNRGTKLATELGRSTLRGLSVFDPAILAGTILQRYGIGDAFKNREEVPSWYLAFNNAISEGGMKFHGADAGSQFLANLVAGMGAYEVINKSLLVAPKAFNIVKQARGVGNRYVVVNPLDGYSTSYDLYTKGWFRPTHLGYALTGTLRKRKVFNPVSLDVNSIGMISSAGNIKGVSEDLYNAIIAYTGNPVLSGEDLLMPEVTTKVWEHFPDKTIVDLLGTHMVPRTTKQGLELRLPTPGTRVTLNSPSKPTYVKGNKVTFRPTKGSIEILPANTREDFLSLFAPISPDPRLRTAPVSSVPIKEGGGVYLDYGEIPTQEMIGQPVLEDLKKTFNFYDEDIGYREVRNNNIRRDYQRHHRTFDDSKINIVRNIGGEDKLGGWANPSDKSITIVDGRLADTAGLDYIATHEGAHIDLFRRIDSKISSMSEDEKFIMKLEQFRDPNSLDNLAYNQEQIELLNKAYGFTPEYLQENPDLRLILEKGATNTDLRYMISRLNSGVTKRELELIIEGMSDDDILYTLSLGNGYARNFLKNIRNSGKPKSEAVKDIKKALIGVPSLFGVIVVAQD